MSAVTDLDASVSLRLRSEWKYWWRTVWLMEGASLWKSFRTFPRSARHVLEMLGEVYRYDAEARDGA